jgi:hypothetical protein
MLNVHCDSVTSFNEGVGDVNRTISHALSYSAISHTLSYAAISHTLSYSAISVTRNNSYIRNRFDNGNIRVVFRLIYYVYTT